MHIVNLVLRQTGKIQSDISPTPPAIFTNEQNLVSIFDQSRLKRSSSKTKKRTGNLKEALGAQMICLSIHSDISPTPPLIRQPDVSTHVQGKGQRS